VLLLVVGLGLPVRADAGLRDPDEGSFGVQLLDAPASRRGDPRALRYVVDHLPPGTTISRRMLVANKSDQALLLDVYPAAATVENEKFTFGEGRSTNELVTWISLDHGQLALEPGGHAEVAVTIQVPPKASAGERYAVVWASVTSQPDPSANVNRVNRVGIRVYLDVGPGGEPTSSFAIGQIVPARDPQGRASLDIGVTNTGGRALDLSGKVVLANGPGGQWAGPFSVVQGTTLAPGQSGAVTVQFPAELPNGPWSAEINLESGLVTQSATVSITFPDPGVAGQPGWLSAVTSVRGIAGTSLVVGLLVLFGMYLLIRRSRTGRTADDSDTTTFV
jgi:hypothetical protein